MQLSHISPIPSLSKSDCSGLNTRHSYHIDHLSHQHPHRFDSYLPHRYSYHKHHHDRPYHYRIVYRSAIRYNCRKHLPTASSCGIGNCSWSLKGLIFQNLNFNNL